MNRIETIDALFHDYGKNGKSPFQIRWIKSSRYFKNPDEILLLYSLDSSDSPLPGIKTLKNSIDIASGPQLLKLGVDAIASLIFFIANTLVNFLIPVAFGVPKFLSVSASFQKSLERLRSLRIQP